MYRILKVWQTPDARHLCPNCRSSHAHGTGFLVVDIEPVLQSGQYAI